MPCLSSRFRYHKKHRDFEISNSLIVSYLFLIFILNCCNFVTQAIFGSLEENLVQLKEALQEKEAENELLRAELALVKTQHDNLARLTRFGAWLGA